MVAWVPFSARMVESNCRPMSGQACLVSSPLPYPNTMPFAIITGSPRFISREIHAGARSGLPLLSSPLNPATPAPLVLPLERRNAAVLGQRRVHDRELRLRVGRPPERRQNPSCSRRVLPRREPAPAAGILEINFLVAEQRRLEQRRLMIGAAERLRVEQIHPALLARGR